MSFQILALVVMLYHFNFKYVLRKILWISFKLKSAKSIELIFKMGKTSNCSNCLLVPKKDLVKYFFSFCKTLSRQNISNFFQQHRLMLESGPPLPYFILSLFFKGFYRTINFFFQTLQAIELKLYCQMTWISLIENVLKI